MSQDKMSQDKMSQDEMSQDEMSQDEMSQDKMSSERNVHQDKTSASQFFTSSPISPQAYPLPFCLSRGLRTHVPISITTLLY